MVGRNVQQHRYMRPKGVHVIQHKAANLQHVIIKLLGGHLVSKAFANVTRQTHV